MLEEVETNWQTSRPCCCQGVLRPRLRRRRLDAESLPWTRSRARCCLVLMLMVGLRRSASGRVHSGVVAGVNTRDLDR